MRGDLDTTAADFRAFGVQGTSELGFSQICIYTSMFKHNHSLDYKRDGLQTDTRITTLFCFSHH